MGNKTLLDAALGYAALGWAVFPLSPRSKVPPKGSHGWHDATTDPDKIRAWWQATPDANIGMAPGLSGLVAVDIDPRHEGDKTWAELTTELGQDVAHTLTNQTGSGGRHFLYRQNGRRVKSDDGTLGPGVDTIGQTGYIILPPSIHPCGSPMLGHRIGRPTTWTRSRSRRPLMPFFLSMSSEPARIRATTSKGPLGPLTRQKTPAPSG